MVSLSVVSIAQEIKKPREIRLVFETKQNPPYIIGIGTDINWNKPGITLELFKIVEKKLGVKISFKRVRWNRGLYLVSINEADGIFHSSYVEKRLSIGRYPMKDGKVDTSRRIKTLNYSLYVLKGSPIKWDGKQLLHLEKAVGATTGYSVVDDLEKLGIPVDEGKEMDTNLLKLLKGRISAYAEIPDMLNPYLKKNQEKYEDIIKLEPPIKVKPAYLMLSHGFTKNYPEFAEKMWSTLAEVKFSEEFKKLEDRYWKELLDSE